MVYSKKDIDDMSIDVNHTLKGCVHWFKFTGDNNAKTINDVHPCMIIGKNNVKSKRVIISPISDAENYLTKMGELRYPFHVLLKKSEYSFLDKDSVLLLDQVITIPRVSLHEGSYMGQVTQTRQIDEAIMQNYDLIDTVKELLHEMIDRVGNTALDDII